MRYEMVFLSFLPHTIAVSEIAVWVYSRERKSSFRSKKRFQKFIAEIFALCAIVKFYQEQSYDDIKTYIILWNYQLLYDFK